MPPTPPQPVPVPSLRSWTLAVVKAHRPDETAAFDALVEPYLTSRGSLRRQRGSADQPLGSGLDTAVGLLTPAAVLACAAAREALIDTVKEEVSGRVGRLVRRVLGSGEPNAAGTEVILTVETLTAVRRASMRAAQRSGFGEAEARALADAVTGALLEAER